MSFQALQGDFELIRGSHFCNLELDMERGRFTARLRQFRDET